MFGRYAIDHACGVEGAHDFSGPFLSYQQPLGENGKNLVRIDKAAVFRHSADAIGITIGRKPGIAALFHHGLLQHRHMSDDRFGIDARKQRVQLLTDGHVPNAAVIENPFQHTASGAVHRIYGELEIRFGNCLEIGEATDGFDVTSLQVDVFNRSFLTAWHRTCAQFVFDRFHDRGRARSTELAFEFHPIPVKRIMARRNHHAASGTELLYRKGNRWRRRIVVRQLHWNAGPGQNFRHDSRGLWRHKASIVTDDYSTAGVFVLENISRNRTRNSPHVVKGEIVGDDASPTVGTEFDGSS